MIKRSFGLGVNLIKELDTINNASCFYRNDKRTFIINWFYKVYGNLIQSILLSLNYIFLVVYYESLASVAYLLKYDAFFFNYISLLDISVVDYPARSKRFELNYIFIIYGINTRVILKTTVGKYTPVMSFSKFYSSAGWLEREAWDMFGVFFSHHADLRRILTDYGFSGHPLLKDYPVTGYFDIYYNDSLQAICHKPLELSQNLRFYKFLKP